MAGPYPWEVPGSIRIFDGPFTVQPSKVIQDVLIFLHDSSYAPYVLGLIFFICLICGINKKLKDHLNRIAIKTVIIMLVLWISIYVLPYISLYDSLPIVSFDRGGIMLILPVLLASIPWIKSKGV
jgi:amino acid permease